MNDYYDYYTYSSPPTFNPLPTIISLVLCVFVLVCMWIVFRKAGKPGWAAIVPFYNLYVLFDITWGSGMRFLLLLIPIYNIILGIQTQVRLARAFGKSGGFAAGLVFLPYIFIPLLAFGKETYQGVPVKAAPYQNNPYQQGRLFPAAPAALSESLFPAAPAGALWRRASAGLPAAPAVSVCCASPAAPAAPAVCGPSAACSSAAPAVYGTPAACPSAACPSAAGADRCRSRFLPQLRREEQR